MARCPTCRKSLGSDPGSNGARCPRCREPLYESPERQGRQPEPTGHLCAIHPAVVAVGHCQRCGNYFCRVCRTKWRDRAVCVTCIDRALELRDQSSPEARDHRRQAILGLVLGVTPWALCLLGFTLVFVGVASGANEALLGLAVMAVVFSVVPAALGLGQAAAAIRVRGEQMIIATLGLVLSSLFLGAGIGFFTFLLMRR
jgi:hypothetical protein